jgi:hypothetical protein
MSDTFDTVNTQVPLPVVNAFAQLGIPETFDLCLKTLDKHYEQVQWEVHPDQWSSELAKGLAHQRSLALNNAYEILRTPESRAAHLLQLGGHWPLPPFPELFEIILSLKEMGHHPDAPSYGTSCQLFSESWNNRDVVGAQKAYWWMISLRNKNVHRLI